MFQLHLVSYTATTGLRLYHHPVLMASLILL
eukprot:SAG31_NODE_15802_length_738_cov_1.103286_1_plen_30_part_10